MTAELLREYLTTWAYAIEHEHEHADLNKLELQMVRVLQRQNLFQQLKSKISASDSWVYE